MVAGVGIAVEGTGSQSNPYRIINTGGSDGGGATFLVEGTGIDITGEGSAGDPYIISATGAGGGDVDGGVL